MKLEPEIFPAATDSRYLRAVSTAAVRITPLVVLLKLIYLDEAAVNTIANSLIDCIFIDIKVFFQ